MVAPAGSLAEISDTGNRLWRAFFDELRRLGDVEGQNLTVERYSGEGRSERYADLAREVVNRNPDVIVALTNTVALAVRAVTDTIPIVWIGVEPVRVGFATSLARPGGSITGVTTDTGHEILGKYLQILKEAVPAASNAIGDSVRYLQLIVELVEKSRLPAIYPYRDYVERCTDGL
jgi:putative tryptophan/tyrosine transport system substrate-binding protein